MSRLRQNAAGFTLLEMMIAMAILSGALTWLVVGMSRNIKAANHAKLTTTATFLAREKIVEFEDTLYDKGFGEFDNSVDCALEDKDFARFGCAILVEKVQLPNQDEIQTMMTKANEARTTLGGVDGKQPPPSTTTSGSSSNNPMTAGAGALASQFGIIKDVLEQGIRRVTVKVLWHEGRKEENVELVTYYTDVRKVDQAIQIAAAGPSGPTGATGATGSTSGGTTSGGTTGGTPGH